MSRKKVLLTAGVIINSIIVLIAAILLLSWRKNVIEDVKVEREWEEHVEMSYRRVNTAFFLNSFFHYLEEDLSYQSYPQERIDSHPHGIDVTMYLMMLLYWHETGTILSQDTIQEYFSQEFEPDGSLRLYNNGNHPEIWTFVEWLWDGDRQDRWQARRYYWSQLSEILTEYVRGNEDSFEWIELRELPPEMLWALARANANPNYVLDLTTLQEAGH